MRFWAISLIIASHCGFLAQGGVGNTIFFAMSGFFVCQPFVMGDYEYDYFSIKTFIVYYLKRIVRIFPVAWVCMFIGAWGFRSLDFRDFETENSLFLNMFFIKSKGHLWFLQQEVFFYICAPLLILIIALLKKLIGQLIKNKAYVNLMIFVILNISVYFTYTFIPLTGFLLHGNGGAQPPLIWLFLIGMSFAYLLKAIRETWAETVVATMRIVGSVYVVICLLLTIISSEQIISVWNPGLTGYFVGWENQILVTYLASGMLLVLSLLPQESLIIRIMGNRLFTAIGNASFSMYLLHFFMISYFAELSVYSRLLVVYFITLCMALIIYEYFEKPLTKRLNALIKRI